MAHPMKDASIVTAVNKHRSVIGHIKGMEHPYKRAQRLSGTQPTKGEPVPEAAVPQFENDRAERDVAYGHVHKLDNQD